MRKRTIKFARLATIPTATDRLKIRIEILRYDAKRVPRRRGRTLRQTCPALTLLYFRRFNFLTLLTSSEIHLDAALGVFEGLVDLEAELLAHVLHFSVFEQGVGDQAAQFLVFCDIDNTFGELCTQAFVLPFVGDYHRELGGAGGVDFAHATDPEDFIASLAKTVFGD